jgi:hypothetical protein
VAGGYAGRLGLMRALALGVWLERARCAHGNAKCGAHALQNNARAARRPCGESLLEVTPDQGSGCMLSTVSVDGT